MHGKLQVNLLSPGDRQVVRGALLRTHHQQEPLLALESWLLRLYPLLQLLPLALDDLLKVCAAMPFGNRIVCSGLGGFGKKSENDDKGDAEGKDEEKTTSGKP